jgi:hypothetical protein
MSNPCPLTSSGKESGVERFGRLETIECFGKRFFFIGSLEMTPLTLVPSVLPVNMKKHKKPLAHPQFFLPWDLKLHLRPDQASCTLDFL